MNHRERHVRRLSAFDSFSPRTTLAPFKLEKKIRETPGGGLADEDALLENLLSPLAALGNGNFEAVFVCCFLCSTYFV